MESTAPVPAASPRVLSEKVDPQAVAVWLLGFGLVVYLGLEGGGYEPVVRGQLGIAIWWGVLLGLAVGALPLARLCSRSWLALSLLAAYVGWTALSCVWTDAPHNSVEEMGKAVTYLGVFALALGIRGAKGARRMVSALAAGVAVIALIGLASRLHPAWFPAAQEAVDLFGSDRFRLAYPLGYWNAVASLIAIGLPLLLYVASSARRTPVRALAAAVLPALALTVYLTFSRGGALAAIAAAAIFFALAHDRLAKAATALVALVGAAILIVAAHQRGALEGGFPGAAARHQGDELLAMTLVVCAGVGLISAGLSLTLRHCHRPALTTPSRRISLSALAAVAAILLGTAVAFGAPARISHAWDEFKASPATPAGATRLESFSGNGRWLLWREALEETASAPLTGRGPGSFEGWWAQHRKAGDSAFVQDAHSLYLETLAELGLVGFALLVAFLSLVFVAGGRRYLRRARGSRTQIAAALAGCAAFCLGAAYDWLWQIALLPIVFLLLASVLFGAGEDRRHEPLPGVVRLTGVVVSVAAMVAIAIPLAGALSLRQSQSAFRAGNLDAALAAAGSARNATPFAARPRLQEAFVLEAQGRAAAALGAARAATRVEPGEWRAWVVRSRLEGAAGHPGAALVAYRRARFLNPQSPLFRR